MPTVHNTVRSSSTTAEFDVMVGSRRLADNTALEVSYYADIGASYDQVANFSSSVALQIHHMLIVICA